MTSCRSSLKGLALSQLETGMMWFDSPNTQTSSGISTKPKPMPAPWSHPPVVASREGKNSTHNANQLVQHLCVVSVWVPRRSIVSCCSCASGSSSSICRSWSFRRAAWLESARVIDGAKRLWRFEISAEHRHLICPTERESKANTARAAALLSPSSPPPFPARTCRYALKTRLPLGTYQIRNTQQVL